MAVSCFSFTECAWTKHKKDDSLLKCAVVVTVAEQKKKKEEDGEAKEGDTAPSSSSLLSKIIPSSMMKKDRKKKKTIKLDLILDDKSLKIASDIEEEEEESSLLLLSQWDGSPSSSSVYLEWLDDSSGRYIYYNLRDLIITNDGRLMIDKSHLSVSDKKFIHSFDESCALDAVLFEGDTLIKSPFRSTSLAMSSSVSSYSFSSTNWTRMGIYSGHWLYLGGTPTLDFVRSQAISHLFNCRMSANKSEITDAAKRGETIFDVARWSHSSIRDESLQLSKLDEMIDVIHTEISHGNVFIHCLAGAHRSPFITACFLVKYGGMSEQSALQIYQHMKSLRRIVEPLSYDKWLTRYKDYLK